MLDTDTVSYALRGQGDVEANIQRQRPSELCISSITLAELRFGADVRASAKIHRLIDTFTAAVQVMPFDAEGAARFGVVAATLRAQGSPIGQFDVLIAAHAMALRLTLVTNNVQHFNRVRGLKIEKWT
jgi:tRNA(fMet)-specific endonuclease VapC